MRECATVDIGDDENKRDGTGDGADHYDGGVCVCVCVCGNTLHTDKKLTSFFILPS